MKKRKMITATAVVFTALVMFVGCGSKNGEKEHSKALEAWNDGDLVRAQTLLEKSIRKTTGNEQKSESLNQLGLVLWELGKTAEAADAFSQSANLSEELSGANLNMGIALFHAGRLDEAEVALNNVLGENPRNETALAVLGMIEMQKRDWGGAAAELAKSATVNPADPAAQNALALAQLQQTKNVSSAINRLKGVVNAYPDYAPALYNLGAVYELYVKNNTQAMSWYKQYLAKAGAEGSHVQAANAALARLGGQPVTTQDNRNLPRSNPAEATRYMNEGLKLYSAKKYDEAVASFKKAQMADPKQKNVYYNLGLTFYAQGNYSDAAMACNKAVNLDPNFADAQYMLSLAYAKQKKWSDAERAAKELKKTDKTKGEQMLNYIANMK